MKKLILSGLLTMTALSGAFAQNPNPRWTEEQKQEFKKQFEAYKTQLNLSPEQEPKVEAINRQYFESLGQLKNAEGSKMSKYRKFKQVSDNRDRKMKEVLTKDQYAIYTKHKEQMRSQARAGRNR